MKMKKEMPAGITSNTGISIENCTESSQEDKTKNTHTHGVHDVSSFQRLIFCVCFFYSCTYANLRECFEL